MPFDFANLKVELRNDLWPSGEKAPQRAAHDKYFAAACNDLQRWVDCLKKNNVDIIDQCATYFNCGVTMFDYDPGAIVRGIRVVDRVDPDTGKSDANHPIDWCTEIHYKEVKYCDIEKFMGSNNGLSCISAQSLSQIFDIPTAWCNKTIFPKPDDADHNHKAGLPLGFHYGQSSTDSDCGRSRAGFFAKYRGRIYLAPWIESSESIILDYDGVKRVWNDNDLVPDHPEYLKAVKFFVLGQHKKRLERDIPGAEAMFREYQVALQNVAYDCREGNRVRDCRDNESHARQAVIPASVTDSGEEETPSLENQKSARVDAVSPVEFWPPAGSKVLFPSKVVLSTPTPESDIYFTIDGTKPTADSFKYSGPIEVGSTTKLRAVAIKSGAYSEVTDAKHVAFCVGSQWWRMHTTDDKAGVWGDFGPNGEGDHAFVLNLMFLKETEIKSIDIMPLDANAVWDKVSVWSTRNQVSPAELEGNSFATAYPLVLFQTGEQINATYLNTLGTFTEGLRWLIAYVEPFNEVLEYFRAEIELGDGSKVYGLIYGKSSGDIIAPPACPVVVTATETMANNVLTAVMTINGVSCSIFFAYRQQESKWVISDWGCASDPDMELDSSIGFDADLGQILQIKGILMGSLFTVCYQTPDAYTES